MKTPGACAVALLVAMGMAGQGGPAAAVRITSPADGAYVMGPVRLAVTFEPLSVLPTVREVRWFADGRQVCTAALRPFTCEWDAGNKVSEHAIRAVAVLQGGERLIATSRTAAVEYAEAVDVDVVQVTAVVTDRDGRFVTNLAAGDFRIYDDDKPQRISNFASENIALELVAAVDVSSSMKEALPAVKRHATSFLAQLQVADQVTVLGFNDNIFTLARRSTDQAVRAKAIERLAPWGGTALYDVLVRALDLLGRQSGRRALLVFSDGEDQSSHATMASVLQRAEASDATIYMIGQGRALRAPSLQQLMKQLASVSGGRAFFSDDEARLEGIFHEIVEDLRHQYLLAYVPPDNARNGDWHRIRVEVPAHGHAVRARLGYRLVRRNPQ
jgi:Ca-activated chloride channel homolog